MDETITGTIIPGQSEPGSNNSERVLPISFTQSAGAVEYTDCVSAEE